MIMDDFILELVIIQLKKYIFQMQLKKEQNDFTIL